MKQLHAIRVYVCYNSIANTVATKTVKIPAIAIDSELMAPSTSPISNAFTVPMA